MCNYVHRGLRDAFKEIPKEGTGFKLFGFRNGKLRAWNMHEVYDTDESQWVTWNRPDCGDGFCFFMSLSDIPQNATCFSIIAPIQYKEGLGTFLERSMVGVECKIAICRAFRPIFGASVDLEF